MRPACSFNLAELRQRVKPFRLHWFARLRSTNDHAVMLRKRRELFAPAIVLTGHQSAGRGRGANSWWSGRGSLTATFALPIAEHAQPHQVPLLAGLAVRAALVELSECGEIQLKWPNDLLLHDRKLAGLLCERVQGVDLIGVGVNVNVDLSDVPRELRDRTATLLQEVSRPIDMNVAVATIARSLHARLSRPDEHPFSAALREYDRHHALVGRRVAVSAGMPDDGLVSGTVVGLDGMGRLLLRDRSGVTVHRVVAGHVSIR